MADQDIATKADNPKRARGDSGEVEAHSLKDQIDAERYLNSKQAMAQTKRGMRFTLLKNPAAP